MISRRNIRINALLTIYEQIQQNGNVQKNTAVKSLDDTISQTGSLFACVWHFIILLSDYVLIYANQKASKHRPTFEDLNINCKIIQNEIIKQLKNNTKFSEIIKKNKLSTLFDVEFIRQIFYAMIEEDFYKQYLIEQEQSSDKDQQFIDKMLHFCIYENEVVSSFLEEKYINYDIDIELIKTWTEKIVANPENFNFSKIISNNKLEYAHELVETYVDKYDTISSIIEPKLIGWDVDRVAILDRIILHLGISEMLYFPSIPIKVTINEYIDIAKGYSTQQSGQFVNGLLDNVRKDLEQQNKINKQDFIKREKK